MLLASAMPLPSGRLTLLPRHISAPNNTTFHVKRKGLHQEMYSNYSTSRESSIVLFGWLPLSFKVPQEKQKQNINTACSLYRQKGRHLEKQ
jgi:hypothetical protein